MLEVALEEMRRGKHPKDAALEALQFVVAEISTAKPAVPSVPGAGRSQTMPSSTKVGSPVRSSLST